MTAFLCSHLVLIMFSLNYFIDDTGIIFLDYNQPLYLLNKIFAIFKSQKYVNQLVTINGWYRRSPTPYIEIYEWFVNGEHKKVYSFITNKIFHIIFALVGLGLIIWYFI